MNQTIINQSVNRSIGQSINRSINQSINQFIYLSIYQSIYLSIYVSSNQLLYQSINPPHIAHMHRHVIVLHPCSIRSRQAKIYQHCVHPGLPKWYHGTMTGRNGILLDCAE